MSEDKYRSVGIALDTARDLLGKMEPGLRHGAQVPALAVGLLKAIMECPNCPGTFRVPLNDDNTVAEFNSDWKRIGCPKCRQTWIHQSAVEAPRRRGRPTAPEQAGGAAAVSAHGEPGPIGSRDVRDA